MPTTMVGIVRDRSAMSASATSAGAMPAIVPSAAPSAQIGGIR